MTPSEFKAWFDGFTEALTGVPTKPQWARIKARVAEIDGRTVSEKVFIDRYWPTYPRQVWTGIDAWPLSRCSTTYAATAISSGQQFNSITAMGALGRVDACEGF